MIYITGDTHGDVKRIADFCSQYNTTKDDILVILGDSGYNYYKNMKDIVRKEMTEVLPITVFCIHGNHEERPYNIDTYVTKIWNNGIVYYEKEYPNLLFAKDGEVYTLNGKKCVVLGGAYSVDKEYRLLRGWNYFESELPTPEIMEHAEEMLSKNNWKVDYVFSHTCPLKYEPREWFLDYVDQNKVDKTAEIWLEEIEEKLAYKKWYCGHFHGSKVIDKLRFMFEDYVELCE